MTPALRTAILDAFEIERRAYIKRQADALLVVDAQILYRRIYRCTDEPKSYGSPWMEPRRRSP